ncbi:MAG: VCBS repeat-containing protein [Phaeodactylibacter sp.]|nr:VCBS repeat-containing protein [Phaeodactylibacter sp.]
MKILLNSWWFLLLLAVFTQCQDAREASAGKTYEAYCGSCHIPPSPASLPKFFWAERVLPEMGARLGVRIKAYDPLRKMSWAERTLIQQQNFYPRQALISDEDWQALYDFILENAPDALPENPPLQLEAELPLFEAKPVSLDRKNGAFTTFISFDDTLGLLIGNGYGELLNWEEGKAPRLLYKTKTPMLSYHKAGAQEFLLEVGEMRPSELSSGVFHKMEGERMRAIQGNLHRPVYALLEDLNGDGRSEALICEYGHYTGRLSLLEEQGGGKYSYENLLNVPGILRVVLEDMDRDGRKDLVLMAAQGDEGVDILYQEDSLQFRRERVLRFSPVYGSSWFELVDYDGDGHKDIITVNGDNADYSYTLKPYHGVRIFINDGGNQFSEQFFYPIHGATRVVARDFDQDGDMDLAVTCFFPDFERHPEASFVYLENIASSEFQFKPRAFPGSADGRWLIMEAGDYDGDGDEDLILGSMTYSLMPIPKALVNRWQRGNTDIVILRNRLN